MTLAALRQEYETELIGARIYARVRELLARALRSRDPGIYGHGSTDRADAVEEVLQDFVLDVLIRERQIDYIMAVSAGQEDFDRLVSRHIRRYMARTRLRTVIDNLIDRSVHRLRQPPFQSDGVGAGERFAVGRPASDNPASENELRRAGALAQAIPKDRSSAETRAPRVYDADRLTQVLTILVREARGWIRRPELQTFFAYLLTPWTASVLDDTERNDLPTSQLGPAEVALVNDTAEELVTGLTEEARTILTMKSANLPDRDLAIRLGVSRPTVAHRKTELFAMLRAQLEPIDASLHSHIMARVTDLLATEERSGPA